MNLLQHAHVTGGHDSLGDGLAHWIAPALGRVPGGS